MNDGATSPRYAIFNADDFGMSRGVNAGVIASHENGVVRSASLMANGAAFDEAAQYARENASLDIGVHFALCDGQPVCDPAAVRSLVQDGVFFAEDHGAFLSRYSRGKISVREIAVEFAAQVARVRGAGLRVTHLDSHQHLHALPAIFQIVLRIAQENGIPAVRVPDERRVVWRSAVLRIKRTAERVGLSLIQRAARRHLGNSDVLAPDHFSGFMEAGRWNSTNLCETIRHLSAGVTEICCHPRCDSANEQIVDRRHNFREELEALTSPELRRCLENEAVRVASFAERFPI